MFRKAFDFGVGMLQFLAMAAESKEVTRLKERVRVLEEQREMMSEAIRASMEEAENDETRETLQYAWYLLHDE